MGIRDKLSNAKFTAEGAARAAKSKLGMKTEEARERSPDAKRVARKAGRVTERVVQAAEAAEGGQPQRRRPRDNREVARAAGRTAESRGPIDATLDPLSNPEQTYAIAGGAPQRGQPLDELAVGRAGRGEADRREGPAPIAPVGGLDVGMTGNDSQDEMGDPLTIDSPFVGGGSDDER